MPSTPCDIDREAIAWAYQKLLAYGVGNITLDNALMLDRLNLTGIRSDAAARGNTEPLPTRRLHGV